MEPLTIDVNFDPGKDTGWARYDYGKLVACGLCHPESFLLIPELTGLAHIDPRTYKVRILIEGQQVYRQSKTDADPNDIIKLAHKAGAIGMSVQQFYRIRYGVSVNYRMIDPADWKGQRSKTICHAQMLPALSKEERKVLDAALLGVNKSQKLDIKDAVCLGLHHLMRAR